MIVTCDSNVFAVFALAFWYSTASTYNMVAYDGMALFVVIAKALPWRVAFK